MPVAGSALDRPSRPTVQEGVMSLNPGARLHVIDVSGGRDVPIIRSPFTIGRKEGNTLQLTNTEVSRSHAEILLTDTGYLLRDLGSRLGTFVNDRQIGERVLTHGDRIQLGRSGGAQLVFRLGEEPHATTSEALSTTVGEIRVVAALLEGLRALGPGRALDDVLALVLDSAIAVSGAERGAIMLAAPGGGLEFNLARRRGKTAAPRFDVSRKISNDAYATGQIQVVTDLQKPSEAEEHPDTVRLGIRHVLCAPLHLVRFADAADSSAQNRRLGVLYLDSSEPGTFVPGAVRQALETLAAEAAVAIENARLYREAAEHARTLEEIRIAAGIQALLLPRASIRRSFVEAGAASLPCRMIGGDFFDYADLEDQRFAFTVGDVAGKGPAAALLCALVQGMFSFAGPVSADPAAVVVRINETLCRRGIESRFATLFYGMLDPRGRLVYCNAGHNPPFVVGRSGVRRIEATGPIVGLLPDARFDSGTVCLAGGDLMLVFSDGVSEALSHDEEQFGDDRILALLQSARAASPEVDPPGLVETLIAAVRRFTMGAPQSDDITAMVVRYRETTAR
jgi:sigma-B regulation protein RsbU (phosphoserine phosphatase)